VKLWSQIIEGFIGLYTCFTSTITQCIFNPLTLFDFSAIFHFMTANRNDSWVPAVVNCRLTNDVVGNWVPTVINCLTNGG